MYADIDVSVLEETHKAMATGAIEHNEELDAFTNMMAGSDVFIAIAIDDITGRLQR